MDFMLQVYYIFMESYIYFQMKYHNLKKKVVTSWGWAEPSSTRAGAMDSIEIKLKSDV